MSKRGRPNGGRAPADPADLAAIHAKSAQTKRERLTHKERAFAARYVANGGNGLQAALAVYDTDTPNVAGAIAHENLQKPKVKAEIEALLAKNGVELNEIVSIHARNARQTDNLGVSQKAIGDFYEILGMKSGPEKSPSVRVAFVIEK